MATQQSLRATRERRGGAESAPTRLFWGVCAARVCVCGNKAGLVLKRRVFLGPFFFGALWLLSRLSRLVVKAVFWAAGRHTNAPPRSSFPALHAVFSFSSTLVKEGLKRFKCFWLMNFEISGETQRLKSIFGIT